MNRVVGGEWSMMTLLPDSYFEVKWYNAGAVTAFTFLFTKSRFVEDYELDCWERQTFGGAHVDTGRFKNRVQGSGSPTQSCGPTD
jgi:hypothetical protein